MRIGHVIGRVTLNHFDPHLRGGRWLVVHPVDADEINTACTERPRLSPGYAPVVYDNLGAGEGDIIGYVEGAEATAPFDHPMPIDAICVAIFDHLHYEEVSS
jgi:microcompartment protein CcmK/EutM